MSTVGDVKENLGDLLAQIDRMSGELNAMIKRKHDIEADIEAERRRKRIGGALTRFCEKLETAWTSNPMFTQIRERFAEEGTTLAFKADYNEETSMINQIMFQFANGDASIVVRICLNYYKKTDDGRLYIDAYAGTLDTEPPDETLELKHLSAYHRDEWFALARPEVMSALIGPVYVTELVVALLLEVAVPDAVNWFGLDIDTYTQGDKLLYCGHGGWLRANYAPPSGKGTHVLCI